MGRPINKKYFGNRNVGDPSTTSDDYGIGGQYVSAIATGTAGSGYSQGLAATVAAPTITGGVTATTSVGVYANGVISGYTVTDGGSGYASAPAITLVKPGNITIASANVSGTTGSNVLTITSSTTGIYVGMKVNATGVNANPTFVTAVNPGNVILSLVNAANISGNALFYDNGTGSLGAVTLAYYSTDVPGAGSQGSYAFAFTANVSGVSSLQGDIVKQESSRRFKISTTDGTAVCHLSNTAPQIGQVRITATDSDGGTYYIDKISARTAEVTQGNGIQFATGTKVPWNISSAVANVSIKILTV